MALVPQAATGIRNVSHALSKEAVTAQLAKLQSPVATHAHQPPYPGIATVSASINMATTQAYQHYWCPSAWCVTLLPNALG